MKENSLLVEKYRPTTLENYVGNENVKQVIQKYLNQMTFKTLFSMVLQAQEKLP